MGSPPQRLILSDRPHVQREEERGGPITRSTQGEGLGRKLEIQPYRILRNEAPNACVPDAGLGAAFRFDLSTMSNINRPAGASP
jgi:hypothetical protein